MEKDVTIKFEASEGAPVAAKLTFGPYEIPPLPLIDGELHDGEYKIVVSGGVISWEYTMVEG